MGQQTRERPAFDDRVLGQGVFIQALQSLQERAALGRQASQSVSPSRRDVQFQTVHVKPHCFRLYHRERAGYSGKLLPLKNSLQLAYNQQWR